MRLLDQSGIKYGMLTYDSRDGKIDGISVSQKIGRDPKVVFKTLVAHGSDRSLFVFVIPVEDELDLKKAAHVTKEKKIQMIPVKDILKYTGYIRGGCSPIGLKKPYPVFIDMKARLLEKLIVSAGQIGFQIELSSEDLKTMVDAEYSDLTT
jgi:Cys-tRNA(Pro)/Cys-tRNA(Cys) deacylase